jgi:hypothetical protein
MDGFEVSGHMTAGSGTPGDGYYAIGQSISLSLDPTKVPMMVAGADALVGQTVRLILTKG